MSKKTGTILVKPVAGELMTYQVESWSTPGVPQLVDLLAHMARGHCSCKWWQTHCWPIIRDRQPELPYDTEGSSVCRHVYAARTHLVQNTMLAILAEDAKGKIAAFIADPAQVVKCMPTPNAKQHVGEVINAVVHRNPKWGDCLKLQVRGRTGKVVEIDQVDHYVRLHSSWDEAIADSRR